MMYPVRSYHRHRTCHGVSPFCTRVLVQTLSSESGTPVKNSVPRAFEHGMLSIRYVDQQAMSQRQWCYADRVYHNIRAGESICLKLFQEKLRTGKVADCLVIGAFMVKILVPDHVMMNKFEIARLCMWEGAQMVHAGKEPHTCSLHA